MVDLVLIHPGTASGTYGADLAHSLVAIEPPLWCRLIAGYIIDRGFTVAIIDQEAEAISATEVARRTEDFNPKLVAIVVSGHQPSASTQQMTAARAVAAAIRKTSPQFEIIMTGNHPSALPVHTLTSEPIDFVADGEGCVTIHGLLNRTLPAMIPGLVWENEDGAITQNPRALLLDLDRDLHGNTWHLLPMKKYRSHNWQAFNSLDTRQPYASIYTTLGCSFKCTFCCINVFQHGNFYRRRNPVAVVDEIEMLHELYNVSTIKIIDELFVLDRRHYTAICEGIIARGLGSKLNLWAYARTDTVNVDQLKLLRAAGVQWLALGIEAGDESVRGGVDKAQKGGNAKIKQTVKAIRDAGISVIGNYIFGLPGDNLDTMMDTLDLAQELNTEFANFYSCMSYPGSQLYDQAIAEGWTLPDTWAGYSQHSYECRPLDTAYIPAAEVLKFRDQAFRAYFSNPRYLEMIEAKFGPSAVEHIQSMLKYKLPRQLLGDPRP